MIPLIEWLKIRLLAKPNFALFLKSHVKISRKRKRMKIFDGIRADEVIITFVLKGVFDSNNDSHYVKQ